jgi:acyl-coenzyme A synthetase/AMP-(fatty) acid ligase
MERPSARGGESSPPLQGPGSRMAELPLIRGDLASVFAHRHGGAISVAQYLGDVQRLCGRLPDREHVLNACSDRYCFAVALGAALARGQSCLLPPNQTPDLLAKLRSAYPDLYCLCETDVAHPGLETVRVAVASGDEAAPAAVPSAPESHVAAVVFTSGSTGEPRPHRKTWGSLVRSALAEAGRLGLGAASGWSLLGTIQPQHMYGFESTVLLAMQGGLAMHAGRPFFPADVCAELDSLPRPRALITTPVHLAALLAEPTALPPADFLLCATAPLAPQLAAQAESRFAAPLHEIYGCTETGQLATRRTVETPEWQPLPGVVLRKDAKGTWASGGHVSGEVLLGDVIELLGRSRFRLHGRTSDLVNVAGKRTSLAHLNYHLNSIDGVRDGAFVMPDEDGKGVTRLMAFVVAPGLTREAIMRALRRRVDPAFLPRPLLLVDALPRNETGKLPRVAVEDLIARVAKAE